MKNVVCLLKASAHALMLVLLIGLFACEKVDIPESAPQLPSGDTEIDFNIEGLKSGMFETGIYTERGTVMILSANANGLPIVNWYWNIVDGPNVYTQLEGQKINFKFESLPGADCHIELVGVTTDSSYTAYVTVNVVYNFDMTPLVVMRKSWYAGSNNYRVDFCIPKNLLKYIETGGPGTYWYAGSWNNWDPINISVADTNINLSSSLAIVDPPNGDMGKYYLLKFTLPVGTYYFGTGKLDVNGSAIWTSFVGEPLSEWVDPNDQARIGFKVTSSGVIPINPGAASMPGEFGDEGEFPILRFDFFETNFTLYVNNFKGWTNQRYVQQRNSDFSWKNDEIQSAVPDFPDWGKVEINYDEGQNGSLFCLRYGDDKDYSSVYNPNSPNSIYWDGWNKHLSFILKDINILNFKSSSGEDLIQPVVQAERRAFILKVENKPVQTMHQN